MLAELEDAVSSMESFLCAVEESKPGLKRWPAEEAVCRVARDVHLFVANGIGHCCLDDDLKARILGAFGRAVQALGDDAPEKDPGGYRRNVAKREVSIRGLFRGTDAHQAPPETDAIRARSSSA